MRIAVVYRSKTGFTKKYAEWLAPELSADVFEASRCSVEKLTDYDMIIYGGGLYGGGINGVKMITRDLDKLQGKKIIVFATGASPVRKEVIEEIRNRNFYVEQQEQIPFFYLRGGFDYSKLNLKDKMMMVVLKIYLKRKKELTADDRGMLAAYENPVDFTRKEELEELIGYIKSAVDGSESL